MVEKKEPSGSRDTEDSSGSISSLNSEKLAESRNRGSWGNQFEFVLSCVGYSVGLGNIWRFPYLTMSQGGGAFLIPYGIFLFLVGMPLFFMELAIGQSSGLSPALVFNMVPVLKGIGWCMLAVSFILCIYYNIIIAWVIYYFGMSFQWTLPWSHCDNWWNTDACFVYSQKTTDINATFSTAMRNGSIGRSAAEEFWLHNVLEISDSINDIGGINWKLFACLMTAWLVTFVCLIKGVKSIGKVVYVTAITPYVFLTVILIRGVTLPGAWIGIKYYIIPDWSKLLNFQIWSAAAMQIFFSLGPAWGGLITMASYNEYNHNILRDSILLPILCQATSIYGGFAIFSVIGHLMYLTGVNDVENLIRQGPGLAFIAYPEALSRIPGAAIWSVLFFAMLFTLGLDSQFVTLEAVTSGLFDLFPNSLGRRKVLCLFLVCIVQIGCGLPLVTRAGFHIFQILDWYSSAFSVMFIGFFECVAVSYFYGIRRLIKDIEAMIGPMRPVTKVMWTSLWVFVIPVLTLVMIITTSLTFEPPVSVDGKPFPQWAIIMGWCLALASLIELPIAAIYMTYRHRGNWKALLRPNAYYKEHALARKSVFEEKKAGSEKICMM